MAEQEKPKSADAKMESADPKSTENTVAKSPMKGMNGSEKVSESPVKGETEAAEKPAASVNNGMSAASGSPAKVTVAEKEQNGEAEKEEKSKEDGEQEEPEGSTCVNTENSGVDGWTTGLVGV